MFAPLGLDGEPWLQRLFDCLTGCTDGESAVFFHDAPDPDTPERLCWCSRPLKSCAQGSVERVEIPILGDIWDALVPCRFVPERSIHTCMCNDMFACFELTH